MTLEDYFQAIVLTQNQVMRGEAELAKFDPVQITGREYLEKSIRRAKRNRKRAVEAFSEACAREGYGLTNFRLVYENKPIESAGRYA